MQIVYVFAVGLVLALGAPRSEAATSAQLPFASFTQRPGAFHSNTNSNSNSNINSNGFSNTFSNNRIDSAPSKDSRRPLTDEGRGILDRYNHRYPDGSYEFRYELADGTARYERGYFVLVDKRKSLVVVGYYSYRMPDGRYITVFYNADEHGYRQNQSITPQVYPNLPRSIEVPALQEPLQQDFTTRSPPTTTRRSRL